MGKIIYITGGAKSGKSTFAENQIRQQGYQSVAYIATQAKVFQDAESLQAIAKHRQQRPNNWTTYENFEALDQIIYTSWDYHQHDAYLIDCVTLWINNHLFLWLDQFNPGLESDQDFDAMLEQLTANDWNQLEQYLIDEMALLLEAARETDSDFYIVSNEVGSGIVPENVLSRVFRKLAGIINQLVAQEADTAYLIVSGLEIMLKNN